MPFYDVYIDAVLASSLVITREKTSDLGPHFERVSSAVVGLPPGGESLVQAVRLCSTFNPRQNGSFAPGNSNTVRA